MFSRISSWSPMALGFLCEVLNDKVNILYWIIKVTYFFLAQMVKNLPAMLETQVQSLVQEDPLEKEMAIHSNFLA